VNGQQHQSGPKRTKTEREAARAEVARLDLQGWNTYDIARKLGVSQPQVVYDLRKVRERHIASMVQDRAELVAVKLAQYRATAKEAWLAYQQSKETAVKTLEEETQSQFGSRYKIGSTTERRTGDPRYLEVVLKCLQAERELLGLDAPKKLDAQVAQVVLNWDALVSQDIIDEANRDTVEEQINALLLGHSSANSLAPIEPTGRPVNPPNPLTNGDFHADQ